MEKQKQSYKSIQLQNVNILSLFSNENLFKCSQNKDAILVCCNQKCQLPGIFCGNLKCSCQKDHKKCKNVFLSRVVQNIVSKQQDMPQKFQQLFNTLTDIINQMIEQLSQLRNKLTSEQQHFKFTKEQLEFIQNIKQNKLQTITGKLIRSMQKKQNNNFQFTLLPKEEILQDFEQKRKQFARFCKDIDQKYLKKDIKSYFDLFKDSKILTNKNQKNILQSWVLQIPQSIQNKALKSRLLFRASQNQFSVNKLHEVCEGIPDIVVIVKNNFNKIYGEYAHPIWFNKGQNQFSNDSEKKSFIFSLNQKIKINCSNRAYAIRYSPNYQSIFRINTDIYIQDKSNSNAENGLSSHSENKNMKESRNFSSNIGNNNKSVMIENQYLSGFYIKQFEVFQIIGL